MRLIVVLLAFATCFPHQLFAQDSNSAQVSPPMIRRAEPPSPTASAEQLEMRGDVLRAEKYFLDALDYYEAAIKKSPRNEVLYNKAGMSELLVGHYRDAKKYFEQSVHLNHQYADGYNNLGVIYYTQRNYGKAIKMYKKAIRSNPNLASFYSNLGAAYFSKKKWQDATMAYTKAISLDPNIFTRTALTGVVAQMSSPEDRARFQFDLAKIYAKNGYADNALLCLRRAIEGGFKQIDEVYKDDDFAALRKDPRFVQLMSNKPAALSE